MPRSFTWSLPFRLSDWNFVHFFISHVCSFQRNSNVVSQSCCLSLCPMIFMWCSPGYVIQWNDHMVNPQWTQC
jgi:hypothetical protein